MNENEFQDRAMNSLRQEGAEVTKFTDQFAIGLPDLFIGSPKFGAFAELKYFHRASAVEPTRVVSKLMKREITGSQQAWLRKNWMKPLPTGALIGTNTGGSDYQWVFVPSPKIEAFLELPFSDIPWTMGKVTLAGLLQSMRDIAKIP